MSFSLRWLMLAVAYAALVCAAMVYRSPFLGSAVLTLTLVIAFGATVAAWRSVGGRAFYGPLALAIWLYMAVLFYEPLEDLESELITNHLVCQLWLLMESPEEQIASDELWVGWQQSAYQLRGTDKLQRGDNKWLVSMYKLNAFYQSIHCAFAVLVGVLAGWITVCVERKPAERSATPLEA